MAKKSKSRFTNFVKFVSEDEDEVDFEQEPNNEIRTNILDGFDDEEFDEYDEYIPDEDRIEETNKTIDEPDTVEEVIQEEIEEIPEYIESEEITENVIEDESGETFEFTNNTETIDLEELEKESEDNYNTYQNTKNKEDDKMKHGIPEFIKEDKVDVQKNTQQVGAQRYQQMTTVEQPNLKESIILGNTTIKGDIITDAGIQIYGAVIGNIESGGCVQLVGKVEGDISGRSVIITDTSLNGNIHAEDNVSIKAGCVVTGDVSGTKIVLNGTIRGNIDAEGQVDFEAGSVVDGNVSAKSFNIKPGARINGSISTK